MLHERLVAAIDSSGPAPFERVVDLALYSDEGFYATTGQAGGRRGDFITSVESGPLFATVFADWLDGQWREAGQPAVFRVSEVGAGVGTLFRGIHKAEPDCWSALAYTLVERSAVLRSGHETLPSDRWDSSGELPDERQHVIVANELLDNLAFGIAQRVEQGWARVFVATEQGQLVLVPGDAEPHLLWFDDLVPQAALGTRVPLAIAAADWVATARATADHVLVFDYGATTEELAGRGQQGWLRTYAGHQRGSDPLLHLGNLDITHDVPIDQLPPAAVSTQADWLRANGIDDRVEQARTVWDERAHIGDLEALTARSAINEAAALTDAAGLGGFVVLQWSDGSR